jgi:hypothetical protein
MEGTYTERVELTASEILAEWLGIDVSETETITWDLVMKGWFKYQTSCLKLLRSHVLTEYHFWEQEFYRGIKSQNVDQSLNALVEGIQAYQTQLESLDHKNTL